MSKSVMVEWCENFRKHFDCSLADAVKAWRKLPDTDLYKKAYSRQLVLRDAAPDLLEALHEIVREADSTGVITTNGLERARAAIAKAEGGA
jgi:hypothetical protein